MTTPSPAGDPSPANTPSPAGDKKLPDMITLNSIMVLVLSTMSLFLVGIAFREGADAVFAGIGLFFNSLASLFQQFKDRVLRTKATTLILLICISLTAYFGFLILFPDGLSQWQANLPDNATIGYPTQLRVTHPLNVDGEIWVVFQDTNGVYHPQPGSTEHDDDCKAVIREQPGTEYSQDVYVGESKDFSQRYNLYVLVAQGDASALLATAYRLDCRTDEYAGLPRLPQGVDVKIKIPVERAGPGG